MTCPTCGSSASSFQRFSTTLQGVSVAKSMQGYLTCEKCGRLLRVDRFGRTLWMLLIPAVALIIVLTYAFPGLISFTSPPLAMAIWFVVLILVLLFFTFIIWRFARLEAAGPSPVSDSRSDEAR